MEDIRTLQKNIMYLSKGLGDGMEYFGSLPLCELYETIEDYLEVMGSYGKKGI